MLNTITKQLKPESDAERVAFKVISILRESEYDAYIVGGSVRDRMLNTIPAEVDVATNATPHEIQALFKKTILVGVSFGVIIVLLDHVQVEVATFRTDGDYKDGRHPEKITFSSAEGDAQRRDFTINSLFYDPCTNKILDYVNGLKDLEQKTVKAIGDPDQRFNEDYLRMLRAVRFTAHLGFDLDSATFSAIKKNASKIIQISAERIFNELNKILTGHNADVAFSLLDESGLLHYILPEIENLKGVKQPPEFHPEGDVWVHTLLMLKALNQPGSELAWGVLLHDVGKPSTFTYNKNGRESFPSHAKVGAQIANKILKRYRCSNEFIESVNALVYYHMAFGDVKRMKQSRLRRMLARKTFSTELELHRIDCMNSHKKLDNYDFLQTKIKEFENEPPVPKPFISGHDILSLGVAEGRQIGIILKELEECQLNREIKSREEALEWLNVRINPQKPIKNWIKNDHH